MSFPRKLAWRAFRASDFRRAEPDRTRPRERIALRFPADFAVVSERARLVVAAAGAVLLIIALNAWATVSLGRSDVFSARQKLVQVLVVWLLPVFGAVLALYFANEAPTASATKTATGPGPDSESAQYYPRQHSETNDHSDASHHGDS